MYFLQENHMIHAKIHTYIFKKAKVKQFFYGNELLFFSIFKNNIKPYICYLFGGTLSLFFVQKTQNFPFNSKKKNQDFVF